MTTKRTTMLQVVTFCSLFKRVDVKIVYEEKWHSIWEAIFSISYALNDAFEHNEMKLLEHLTLLNVRNRSLPFCHVEIVHYCIMYSYFISSHKCVNICYVLVSCIITSMQVVSCNKSLNLYHQRDLWDFTRHEYYLLQQTWKISNLLVFWFIPQRKICTTCSIFFVFKTWRVSNFVKKHVWNNTEILYWYMVTNTRIFLSHSTIVNVLENPQIHIFSKVLKTSMTDNYAHR